MSQLIVFAFVMPKKQFLFYVLLLIKAISAVSLQSCSPARQLKRHISATSTKATHFFVFGSRAIKLPGLQPCTACSQKIYLFFFEQNRVEQGSAIYFILQTGKNGKFLSDRLTKTQMFNNQNKHLNCCHQEYK